MDGNSGTAGLVACGIGLAIAVLLLPPVAGTAVAAPAATAGAVPRERTATTEADVGRTVGVRPVPGPVVRGFDQPTRFGPGHRGVDLRAAPGTTVRAPVAGMIVFAGRVVDAAWVTVGTGRHRWTVGPLATIGVRRGAVVVAGEPLGTSARAHGLAALHVSLRVGDRYVDPVLAGRPRVSLVPVPGVAPGVGPASSRLVAGIGRSPPDPPGGASARRARWAPSPPPASGR